MDHENNLMSIVRKALMENLPKRDDQIKAELRQIMETPVLLDLHWIGVTLKINGFPLIVF